MSTHERPVFPHGYRRIEKFAVVTGVIGSTGDVPWFQIKIGPEAMLERTAGGRWLLVSEHLARELAKGCHETPCELAKPASCWPTVRLYLPPEAIERVEHNPHDGIVYTVLVRKDDLQKAILADEQAAAAAIA